MLTPKQQYQKEWREKNKEYRSAAAKVYYQNNKEYLTQAKREYRQNNKEHCRALQRKQYDAQAINPKTFITSVFNTCRSGAKRRGLEFTLTREYLTEAVTAANGRCSISNVPLSTARHHPHRVSVDRIDSSKGYIPGNIQIVAVQVNFAKNKFDDLKWFDEMCRSRVKFLNKKGKT